MAQPLSSPPELPVPRTTSPVIDHTTMTESLFQTSLSPSLSSASSTASTLRGSPSTPQSQSRERGTSPTLSQVFRGIGPGFESLPSTRNASTTSRTRERLRVAESERDELRRAVNGERARASEMRRLAEEQKILADRLKREGSLTRVSAADAKYRVSQLKHDIYKAGMDAPRRSTAGLFKAVCSTDLLFLIDTTGSMAGYINAAKEQVKSIVRDIKDAFLGEAEVRIAVVSYKDHFDPLNVEFLDFTSDADAVRTFVEGLSADGGGDEPEDVLGGIRQALNATWTQQTRCVIHIADAPPHGRTLYDSVSGKDDYPEPGSEPHGLTYQPLLKQMVSLRLNYALLRINESTDRMALSFLKVYDEASADCKLHKLNRYYHAACGLGTTTYGSFRTRGSSNRSANGGLLFQETELGVSYSALRHLVVKAVTTSASRTAVRSSASIARKSVLDTDKTPNTNLGMIEEDEDNTEEVKLENVPPQWNKSGWMNETLMVEGFSPDVVMHSAVTLDEMMADDDNIKMTITELTIHKRSQPFAQGAMRLAFYARTTASTNRFVVKSFKKGGKRLAHFAEDMRCQALCKAFALEFNALCREEHSLDFTVTTCMKGKTSEECWSLEQYIEGTYVKYNGNSGYVNEDIPNDRFNHAAQAFSHFTFERSRGKLLVSDLQGVGNLLTDPVIHAADPERFKLADTNLGKEGFKFFFQTHQCNAICAELELKSNASMIKSGSYRFRKTWPSMDKTACCSNKLCGKIVRLSSAKRWNKLPGYHWCDACWPQLRSSMDKYICVADGPHHEFEVSRFFYESQGKSTPRKCAEHGDRDESYLQPVSMCHLFFKSKEMRKPGENFQARMETTSNVAESSSKGHSREISRSKAGGSTKDVGPAYTSRAVSAGAGEVHCLWRTSGAAAAAKTSTTSLVRGSIWDRLKSATSKK